MRSTYLKLSIGFCFSLVIFLGKGSQVFASDYYVSTTGSNTNPGTSSLPFSTFAHAVSVLQPGDTLYVGAGTYNQNLVVNNSGSATQPLTILPIPNQTVIIDGQNQRDKLISVTGSHVRVSGFEVKRSDGYCTSFTGQYINVSGLSVHDCEDHGIYTDGQHIIISSNTVYLSNMMNQDKNSAWGSGIKVKVGGDDITIENNTVYHNYGEGIAATRGSNIKIRDNIVYDNYSVNIYVDNSYDVLVERNFVTCEQAGASEFYRDDHPANAIVLAEEYYDGWGAQLRNVTVQNNITAFCNRGFADYGPDDSVSGGGLDNVLVAYNTFWDSGTYAIYLESGTAKTRNTRFHNNIIHQSEGKLIDVKSFNGLTFDYNYWMGEVPEDAELANGAHDKTGTDVFATTPGYTASSFRLSPSSLAVNNALNISGITDDFERKNRFATNQSSDIGAIELDGSVVVPTSTFTPTISLTPTHTLTPSPILEVTSSVTPSVTPLAGYCAGINIYKVQGDSSVAGNWVLLTSADRELLEPNDVIYISSIGAPSTETFSQARISVSIGVTNPGVYTMSDSALNIKPGSLYPEYYRQYIMPPTFTPNQLFSIRSQVYIPSYDTDTDLWNDDAGWK